MKKNIKEAIGDISVEEFFNEYAMKQIGRRKVLDIKFKNELIDALNQFMNTPRMRRKGMTATEFVNIPTPQCDNLMSEFANWCKKNLKLDVYQNFDDYYLRDRLSDDDGIKEYDDFKFDESDEPGSMDSQSVIDWIGNELSKCKWCSDITFDDVDAIVEVETDEGTKFEISVKKI